MNCKIFRRISWWKILCVGLFVCIANSTLQGIGVGIAAASAAAPTSPETFDLDEGEKREKHSLAKLTFPGILYSEVGKNIDKENERSNKSEEIQLAQVYDMSPQQFSKQSTRTASNSSFHFTRTQMLLLGTFILAVGGIAISSLLPFMTRVQPKLAQSKVRSIKRAAPKVYETDFGELTDLSSAYSMPTKPSITPEIKTSQSPEEILDEMFEENTMLEEDFFVEECNDIQPGRVETLSSLPDPSPTLMRMTKAFFQQSHFEFIDQSKNRGSVRSNAAKYRHYGEIPVFIVSNTSLDETLLQEIVSTTNLRGRSTQKNIMFLIVDELPHSRAYQQIHSYRTEEHIVLIPISYQLITKALRNSTCAQTVEKILSLTLTYQNRYETNNPVEDPLKFFGRDELIRNLLDTVGHLQHIGLFGLRSIGKTSLVLQLREQLSQHIVAYIDLQHVPRDCNYLYYMILEGCRREAAFKYPDMTLPEFDLSPEDSTEKQGVRFIQALVKMWESLKACRHDIKVVLLLDEADHFVPNLTQEDEGFSGFHEFMGIIRGISQEFGFLVSVIVSSHPGISRLDTWKGQSNPGFQYYKEVFLSSLAEDGCNHMITSFGAQMGMEYMEEALSRIYYETGGHPYVTRQLCHLIAENSKAPDGGASSLSATNHLTTIQVQDVEDAITEYIEYKSDYLESVWQRLSPIEQEILLTITTSHSCVLECLISSAQNYEVKRQRRKAISTLIENEIIEKCENKYSIRMGLFERFLLSTN